MIDIGRRFAAIRRVALYTTTLIAIGMVVAGCDSFKKAVGIEHTSPDEFAVESRAPLTIPPDFNLRPPQPGATRPQETSYSDKAQTVIDNAGPGEPGKQEAGTLHPNAGGGQPDSNSQIADQSLAAKLLQTNDTGDAIVVQNRQTSVLEGIH
jgi:hypothetical protein